MTRLFRQRAFVTGMGMLLLGLFIASPLLNGCSTKKEGAMNTKDQENFKGGPMPADFKPSTGSGPPQEATTPPAQPPKK